MDVQAKVEEFFSNHSHLKFKPNEFVIRSSKNINEIFYIKRGNVKQTFINKSGDEMTLNIFGEKSYFPTMLVLGEEENIYDFISVSESELYRVPAEDVLLFLKENPDVLFDLTKRISKGLSKILLKIENLMFEDSYSKLIHLMIYLHDKFGKDGLVNLKLTHSEIGSWIGLPRETVSRQMEKLKEKGYISYKNHLINIENLDKLKSEL